MKTMKKHSTLENGERFEAHEKIMQLEGNIRILRLITLFLILIIIATLSIAMISSGKGDILRVQGLIVEDSDGNPRILIGAPFPVVKERKRDDRTAGILILDDKGIDRLSIGSPAPNPQIKGTVIQRMSPATGIQINNLAGNELTGYGVMDSGSVVLGMDYETGEAIGLFVSKELGYTGLMINGDKRPPNGQRVFLGTNLKKEGPGILVLNDNDGTMYTYLGLKDGTPQWAAYDKDGNLIGDAVEIIKK